MRRRRGTVLALCAIACFAGLFWYAQVACEAALTHWQARLQIAAASAAGRVDGWLGDGRGAVDGAAVNPTIQLYLGQLAQAGFDSARVENGAVQRIFVASYLTSLAARNGFTALALYDARGVLVASTSPQNPPEQGAPLAVFERGGEAFAVFTASVRPLQSNDPSARLGRVIGVRRIPPALWSAGGTELALDGGMEGLQARDGKGTPLTLGPAMEGALTATAPASGWTAVAAIARSEALVETNVRLVLVGVALMLGLVCLALGMWR